MTQFRKKGKLSVERGGLYGARTLSPEEWLDREMRSLAASWKADNGQGAYASRGVANIAHEINYPHRIPARRIREAQEKRVAHTKARRYGEIMAEYADRLYGIHAQSQRPDPDPVTTAMRQAA